MQRQLSPQETQVWELHMAGTPMSEIVATTHLDAGFVRAAICGVWRDDCQVMRYAA